MYNATIFTHEKDIHISEQTKQLLVEASQVYKQNFDGRTWYGRCIFFSWYCKKATCLFCYRSQLKHKNRFEKPAMRSMGSMLLEALFCKVFGWRIEFLTGGYQQDFVYEQIVEIAKNVSLVYGEKIWVNIGFIPPARIEQLRPFVKGVCASIETPTPALHDKVCPDKPIAPYETMFEHLVGFKKSAAFIVGLGDSDEDIHFWFDFIQRHKLDRITVYALKPIRGGHYQQGPTHDQYLQWLAKLRIRFPTLEIIGGTNLRRSEEIGLMLDAGVNAITKFPATKQFGTRKAFILTDQINSRERKFISNITSVPDLNWDELIEQLPIENQYKVQMKEQLKNYLHAFLHPHDRDPMYAGAQNNEQHRQTQCDFDGDN